MAMNDASAIARGDIFDRSGAVSNLLGLPGLGTDVSAQMRDEVEDRQKKLLQGSLGQPQPYSVSGLAAVQALLRT